MWILMGWALQAVLWGWAAVTFVLDNLGEEESASQALQGSGVAASLAAGLVSVPWLLPFVLALLATLAYLYATLRRAGPPEHPINVISKSLPSSHAGEPAACRGVVAFDGATHSGQIEIGAGERAFNLRFSKKAGGSIDVGRQGTDLKRLARVRAPQRDFPVHPDQVDASSDTCTPEVGDYLYAENAFGRHALIRIVGIGDDAGNEVGHHGIRFEYRIYEAAHALPVTW